MNIISSLLPSDHTSQKQASTRSLQNISQKAKQGVSPQQQIPPPQQQARPPPPQIPSSQQARPPPQQIPSPQQILPPQQARPSSQQIPSSQQARPPQQIPPPQSLPPQQARPSSQQIPPPQALSLNILQPSSGTSENEATQTQPDISAQTPLSDLIEESVANVFPYPRLATAAQPDCYHDKDQAAGREEGGAARIGLGTFSPPASKRCIDIPGTPFKACTLTGPPPEIDEEDIRERRMHDAILARARDIRRQQRKIKTKAADPIDSMKNVKDTLMRRMKETIQEIRNDLGELRERFAHPVPLICVVCPGMLEEHILEHLNAYLSSANETFDVCFNSKPFGGEECPCIVARHVNGTTAVFDESWIRRLSAEDNFESIDIMCTFDQCGKLNNLSELKVGQSVLVFDAAFKESHRAMKEWVCDKSHLTIPLQMTHFERPCVVEKTKQMLKIVNINL